jgi:acyl-coenzyme A synthetase/AMP-(fatty) acid ligase
MGLNVKGPFVIKTQASKPPFVPGNGSLMNELEQLAAKALARPASQPAIEFAKQWISWGDLRQLAEQVAALLTASGTKPAAKIALVARNHPSAIAAFVGLPAKGYSIRMVHPFQSAAGIAREIDPIAPADVAIIDCWQRRSGNSFARPRPRNPYSRGLGNWDRTTKNKIVIQGRSIGRAQTGCGHPRHDFAATSEA